MRNASCWTSFKGVYWTGCSMTCRPNGRRHLVSQQQAFTEEQVAAAQLRIALDTKLGRQTSKHVLQIAVATPAPPEDQRSGVEDRQSGIESPNMMTPPVPSYLTSTDEDEPRRPRPESPASVAPPSRSSDEMEARKRPYAHQAREYFARTESLQEKDSFDFEAVFPAREIIRDLAARGDEAAAQCINIIYSRLTSGLGLEHPLTLYAYEAFVRLRSKISRERLERPS